MKQLTLLLACLVLLCSCERDPNRPPATNPLMYVGMTLYQGDWLTDEEFLDILLNRQPADSVATDSLVVEES